MIGIYKITSPSGRVYIGQSIDIENRFKTYKRGSLKKQYKLINSFNKYGCDNHIFEIIEECSIESLNDRERYWQDYYDVLTLGLNCLLTSTLTNSGKLSEETKRKMSEAAKGAKNGFFGKKHSDATKEKFKKRVTSDDTRKKLSDANKRRIRIAKVKKIKTPLDYMLSTKQLILCTNTGIFYKTNREAGFAMGINHNSLKSYLNGQRPNKTSLIYV